MSPPANIVAVVPIERYVPTANASERMPRISTASTSATPIKTSRQGSRWFRIPLMTVAIRRACGAGALSPPMPGAHCTSILMVLRS